MRENGSSALAFAHTTHAPHAPPMLAALPLACAVRREERKKNIDVDSAIAMLQLLHGEAFPQHVPKLVEFLKGNDTCCKRGVSYDEWTLILNFCSEIMPDCSNYQVGLHRTLHSRLAGRSARVVTCRACVVATDGRMCIRVCQCRPAAPLLPCTRCSCIVPWAHGALSGRERVRRTTARGPSSLMTL